MDRYGEVIHKIFFFFKHCLENLNFCQLKTRTFSCLFLILILLVGCGWLAALLLKGCMFYVPQYDSFLSFIHLLLSTAVTEGSPFPKSERTGRFHKLLSANIYNKFNPFPVSHPLFKFLCIRNSCCSCSTTALSWAAFVPQGLVDSQKCTFEPCCVRSSSPVVSLSHGGRVLSEANGLLHACALGPDGSIPYRVCNKVPTVKY